QFTDGSKNHSSQRCRYFPHTLHESPPRSRDCHATVGREPGRQVAGSREQRRTVPGSQSPGDRKESALSANR
ncbi:unnamed protein product, partial [Ectocarpus sp. 4 AP-2014]